MNKIVLVDFDGTIINNHNAMDFVSGTDFCWETFITNSVDSPVNQQVLDKIAELSKDHTIVICTARPNMVEGISLDHMEYLFDNTNLYADMIVFRDDDLHDDELDELEGVTEQEQLREIIHRHHAVYRNHVIDDLEERYGVGCVVYAFDDQEHNLNVMMQRMVKGFLIGKDGTCPETPTHVLMGVA